MNSPQGHPGYNAKGQPNPTVSSSHQGSRNPTDFEGFDEQLGPQEWMPNWDYYGEYVMQGIMGSRIPMDTPFLQANLATASQRANAEGFGQPYHCQGPKVHSQAGINERKYHPYQGHWDPNDVRVKATFSFGTAPLACKMCGAEARGMQTNPHNTGAHCRVAGKSLIMSQKAHGAKHSMQRSAGCTPSRGRSPAANHADKQTCCHRAKMLHTYRQKCKYCNCKYAHNERFFTYFKHHRAQKNISAPKEKKYTKFHLPLYANESHEAHDASAFRDEYENETRQQNYFDPFTPSISYIKNWQHIHSQAPQIAKISHSQREAPSIYSSVFNIPDEHVENFIECQRNAKNYYPKEGYVQDEQQTVHGANKNSQSTGLAPKISRMKPIWTCTKMQLKVQMHKSQKCEVHQIHLYLLKKRNKIMIHLYVKRQSEKRKVTQK
jgi:hypothetical protein